MLIFTLILTVLAAAFMGGANAASNATNGTIVTNVTLPLDVPAPTKIDCNIPSYNWAGVNAIDDGINYLNGLKGDATLGHQPGGGWCWRYSCSYDSGIYGCNDAQEDVQVPWTGISYYASQIKKDCTFHGPVGMAIQGQAWSGEGWNIIIGLHKGEHC
ncbi:hypothetical protein SLS53_008820 [Cytospora paraplurivora]|uniref:Uncharacterized protein n=1 Tax=Cytospora paraplurivora TaxID=2898453 RepID=A0AAN9YCP2_9PEZI